MNVIHGCMQSTEYTHTGCICTVLGTSASTSLWDASENRRVLAPRVGECYKL